ncbi:hypothetical protein SKAU_G00307920 [Synaphobranchus kaupii]|uniref:Uncharacterized protein n=1 Tax=Synaphobranchus kaupii TaxID=118154 RepID=A0A9Q1ER49_SYNKA|nr:hypothetical protein SKAU_G00307920 [Synaphobranchus kaupii]
MAGQDRTADKKDKEKQKTKPGVCLNGEKGKEGGNSVPLFHILRRLGFPRNTCVERKIQYCSLHHSWDGREKLDPV